MKKRFKAGDRVRYTGLMLMGPPTGSTGTVALIAGGPRGRLSVSPDPAGIMTYVEWDGQYPEGVFSRMLEKLKEG